MRNRRVLEIDHEFDILDIAKLLKKLLENDQSTVSILNLYRILYNKSHDVKETNRTRIKRN